MREFVEVKKGTFNRLIVIHNFILLKNTFLKTFETFFENHFFSGNKITFLFPGKQRFAVNKLAKKQKYLSSINLTCLLFDILFAFGVLYCYIS